MDHHTPPSEAPTGPLSAFEDACHRLDRASRAFADSLTPLLPGLSLAVWQHEKLRVTVCRADESGHRRREAVGPRHKIEARLSPEEAEAVWTQFQRFGTGLGLVPTRDAEHEADLHRYYFSARDEATADEVRCLIDLPGPWNIPHLSIGVFVGPRFRRDDPARVA